MPLSPKDQLLTKIAAIFIIFGAPILLILLLSFIGDEINRSNRVPCETIKECDEKNPSYYEEERH